MSDLVLSEIRGPVRHVVLNRPAKRNAFDEALVRATGEALRAAADDPAVRVVVLRGAGPMLSAGMDLGTLGRAGRRAETLGPFRRACLEAWSLAEEMAKPVVCAIHGACLGGAMELALACDLRVMAADAVVGLPETRIGLVPDLGGCSRLPQLVGLGRAKELVLTGRLVGAEEAERIGLVNRVAPPGGARRRRGRARRRAAGLRARGRRARQAGARRLRPARARGHAGAGAARPGALRAHGGLRRGRPRRGREARAVLHRQVTGPVVVLAGGTGGAKLARGMLDVAGEDLVVIANTGDDVEIHGGYVSPDPDLVTFWLADRIDARGWGLRDDTFAVMDGLRELGRGRVVRARRPRPRRLPVARAAARRGRAADRRGRRRCAARWACRRACCRWPTRRCAPGCGRAATGTRSRPS